MDALVAHLALQVRSTSVCWQFTLLARAALKTMPHESLDDVGVQAHTSAVDQDAALGALKRVVHLGDFWHSL